MEIEFARADGRLSFPAMSRNALQPGFCRTRKDMATVRLYLLMDIEYFFKDWSFDYDLLSTR